tara:strand:+ start:7491 stop:8348 length:858 start_codon:yes stop_codon:yes gene_type:complete
MPELPEVEVVTQSLIKRIKNCKINSVKVYNRSLRYKVPFQFEKYLKNKIIKNIRRKSKYIIFEFNYNNYLILHLGMSGTLHIPQMKSGISNLSFYQSPQIPIKHNHVIFNFVKYKLIYNDPRRFGYFKILKNKQEFDMYFTRIGPEALDRKFNLNYLLNKINNRKKNIKNFLLDQKIVSGIGNIYVNEILFKSKILPSKSVRKLSILDLKKILKFSRSVLRYAIRQGGSSIKDFKGLSGNNGKFQTRFKVYNRDKKYCLSRNCNGVIKKIYISNRSTFLCNLCQN